MTVSVDVRAASSVDVERAEARLGKVGRACPEMWPACAARLYDQGCEGDGWFFSEAARVRKISPDGITMRRA